MENEVLNAENEEVVQPQDGAEAEEVTTSNNSDIDGMSDEDFENYLNSARAGDLPERSASEEVTGTGDAEQPEAEEEPASEEVEEEETKPEPFKVFDTQEEYQKNIDTIIGERLRKSRKTAQTLDQVTTQALSFYGGEDGEEAVRKLISDLQEQNAEKRSISVDEFRKQSQDAVDARRYREEMMRRDGEQRQVEEIKQRWLRESEELRNVVPGFDFEQAMQNPNFYNSIVSGMSVSTAYLIANKPQQSAEPPKPKRKPIQQNGATNSATAGTSSVDPETMSDSEFREYLRQIQNE